MDVCGLGTLASFNSIAKSTEMEFLSGVFHLGCGIYYICGTYWDFQIVTPHVNTYGGRWKFLTFLNLVRKVFYFGTVVIFTLTFMEPAEACMILNVNRITFRS